MAETLEKYFVPQPSHFPIFGSIALLLIASGATFWINDIEAGPWMVGLGFATLLYMLFGWFGQVIRESQSGQYGARVDKSFRWSMGWFIFSEVMFFGAFFGTLFYVRIITIPDLGTALQHLFWPGYQAQWPTAGPHFLAPFETVSWKGLPAINTALLLSSAVMLTILLGFIFLGCQAFEYHHAYTEMNLRLSTGIYGSTFFMLTGFHGLHVTIGAIMLTVMLFRSMAGHFTPEHHFAFEAAAWYWHFVDYVWLVLFVVVYIL
jgi:cytochrome c oxidase subunit III